jgi:putative transposase
LFRDALDPEFVGALRRATNGGWPLGNARFQNRLAKALGPRVTPGEPGRPPKPRGDARQLKLL